MKEKITKLVALAITFSIAALAFSVYASVRTYRGFKTESFDKQVEAGIQAFIQKQQEQANKPVRVAEKVDNKIENDDAVLGGKDASITFVEFSDFQCPYCGKFYTQTLVPFKDKFIKTGKVRFVFRDFPLEFHDNAKPAALAAECARDQGGDEAYYKYHDLLFQNQTELDAASLQKYANQIGLNGKTLKSCVDNAKFAEEIDQDFDDGTQAGVSGTPASFILMDKDDSKAAELKAMEMTQGNQYVIQYIETDDGKRMGLRISGAHPLSTFEKATEIGL